MGMLRNPLRRSREQRIPLFHKTSSSPNKEHLSDDDFYTTDDDSDASLSGPPRAQQQQRGGTARRRGRRRRRNNPGTKAGEWWAGLWPYRLPSRKSRFVLVAVITLIALMIAGLVRASQLENWRIANGLVAIRPAEPRLWESFPFLERYYGGLRTLVPFRENVRQYPPKGQGQGQGQDGNISAKAFPASRSWMEYPGRKKEEGAEECFLDAGGSVRPPALQYYDGRPSGFPEAVLGSYEVFKLPEDVCFDRFGRYGPYGFGYSARKGGLGIGEHGEREGADAVWASSRRVDYRKVDWADVQRRCYRANAGRYKTLPPRITTSPGFYVGDGDLEADSEGEARSNSSSWANKAARDGKTTTKADAGTQPRTAVVIRCWDEYQWAEDDILNIRSMITELSMASGGRYDVHLLVQVKNDAEHPIWADHEVYEKRINETVPEEFRGLVTLWTETQMLALYQGIHDLFTSGPSRPVHGVYRGLAMGMQHFGYLHPEYDYYWQWEMDIRYVGDYLELFNRLEDWARAQPRKGLWERNARFYFPSVHGSWEDFSHMARVQNEMGTVSADNLWNKALGVGHGHGDGPGPGPGPAKTANPAAVTPPKSIWGPLRPASSSDWYEAQYDPSPPTSYKADRSTWGVGEEADLITLNPMFDPEGTTWLLRNDITGYERSDPLPPRRASIVTTSRLSRRLLTTMHRSTAHKKQMAFPEMWPATVALHHGLKAVYAPQPIYVDRAWPVDYMAQTYNGGRDGSTGGSRTSVFGDREHNMLGISWFYNAGFPGNLYRRWLGLRVNGDGGEEFEKSEDRSKDGGGSGVGGMRGGEGRMCLPMMLLHPVKEVRLPVEELVEDWEGRYLTSDPSS